MPRKLEFYRALETLSQAASCGNRRAEAVLDELETLTKNVLYALQAGDTAHADELIIDAKAIAYLRQALG